MTAFDIMSQARERLGDEKKQRWNDKRLLTIVSQGQRDICKVTRCLRREFHVPLVDGQLRYILPEDCINLRRLEYRGDVIPIYSRDDIDEGVVIAGGARFIGIKSNLNMGALELYPGIGEVPKLRAILAEGTELTTIEVTPDYGVATVVENDPLAYEMIVSPQYGVVDDASIDFTEDKESKYGEINDYSYSNESGNAELDSLYGVLTDAEFLVDGEGSECRYGAVTDVVGSILPIELDGQHAVSGLYGMVTDVSFEEDAVKVFYDAIPDKLLTIETSLVIPPVWEDMIMRYVVGTALQDDNDANNIQRGEVELQKYTTQVLKTRELSTKDFASNNKEKYITRFRSI